MAIILKVFLLFCFSIFFLDFGFSQLQPGFQRPVILARPQDKPKILAKIARYTWAKNYLDGTRRSVETYADRHQVDPEWILSRMAMHWNQKYTHVVGRRSEGWGGPKNGGTGIYGNMVNMNAFHGTAPVPTPRGRTGTRDYNSKNYHGFPSVEERAAYIGDTFTFRPKKPGLLPHTSDSGRMLWLSYNDAYIKIAKNAAIVYWLTGEEKFAKLAADIFMQFIRGASYMDRPTNWWENCSFFETTLSDQFPRIYQSYDLIHDYIIEHNDDLYYDRRYIDPETRVYPTNGSDYPGRDMRYLDENGNESIELMVDDFAYRHGMQFVRWGGTGNNWEMVETEFIALSALAISDNNRSNRLELISYLIDRNHIRGDWGQSSIPNQLKRLFNDRGLNKEPLSYHNYPVSRYALVVPMLENAGYNIMNNPRFSKLFKAFYVVSEYTFPHGYTTSFGDATAGRASRYFLEVAYKYAKKYNSPEKDRILYELHEAIDQGYNRGGDIFVLENSLEKRPSVVRKKNLSDHVDFANHYLQRNGENELEGLMYTVGAGGFSHSKATGLSIELYAKGFTLAPDSGYGSWGSYRFVNYTSKLGSHNTVVINEEAMENNRKANLIAINPDLESITSVSKNNSFSITSHNYDDNDQIRGIIMNRTSQNSGYYLDVFWSEGNMTDYLYHNLSSGVPNVIFRENGVVRVGSPVNDLSEAAVAYQFLYKQKKFNSDRDIQAEFEVDLNKFDKNVYMKAWIMGNTNRIYYSADTIYSEGGRYEYRNYSNSVMIIRDRSPSYNTKPYIVLYEPYRGDGRGVIDHVRRMNGTKGQSHYVGIAVSNSDRNGQDRPDLQYLISSKNNNTAFDHEGVQFKGYSATVSHNNGELSSLYLGKGSYIANYGYRLGKARNEDISAYLKVEGQKMTLTSQNDTQVTLSYRNNIERAYTNLGLYYKVKGSSGIRGATGQSIVPNDRVTTVGYGTITGIVPNTQTREVLLLPLEKRNYIGVNANSTVKVYHNGRVSRRRVLFDNDSEISFLINSPTGFYSDTLIIKKR